MAKDTKGHGSNGKGGAADDAAFNSFWKSGLKTYEAQKKGKPPVPSKVKKAAPKAKPAAGVSSFTPKFSKEALEVAARRKAAASKPKPGGGKVWGANKNKADWKKVGDAAFGAKAPRKGK